MDRVLLPNKVANHFLDYQAMASATMEDIMSTRFGLDNGPVVDLSASLATIKSFNLGLRNSGRFLETIALANLCQRSKASKHEGSGLLLLMAMEVIRNSPGLTKKLQYPELLKLSRNLREYAHTVNFAGVIGSKGFASCHQANDWLASNWPLNARTKNQIALLTQPFIATLKLNQGAQPKQRPEKIVSGAFEL